MKKLLKILPVVIIICVALTSVFAIPMPELETSYNNQPSIDIGSPVVSIWKTVWMIFILLVPGIFAIVVIWKIYSKSGQPGWASIVPIYTNVVQFKIVGLNPWLLLLYIVPFVNYITIFVLNIVVSFRLAKSFGKDIAWGFGLWLLPIVFYPILAFGSSEYAGPNGEMKF